MRFGPSKTVNNKFRTAEMNPFIDYCLILYYVRFEELASKYSLYIKKKKKKRLI